MAKERKKVTFFAGRGKDDRQVEYTEEVTIDVNGDVNLSGMVVLIQRKLNEKYKTYQLDEFGIVKVESLPNPPGQG